MKKYLQSIIVLFLLPVFVGGKAVAQCTCGATPTTNNWSAFTVRGPIPARGIAPVQTVRCGHQFSICAKDSMSFQGKFNCAGGCNASYKPELKKDGITIEEFLLVRSEFFYTRRFRMPGNYVLVIKPICGNNSCLPCTYYITVVSC